MIRAGSIEAGNLRSLRRGRLLALVLFALLASPSGPAIAADAPAGTKPPETSGPVLTEKQKIADALRAFRKATTAEEREKSFAALEALGPHALGQVERKFDEEFNIQLTKYALHFEKAALKHRGTITSNMAKELNELQTKAKIPLGQSPPAKDALEETDKAVNQMRQILIPKPAEVVKSDPDLAVQRAYVEELAGYLRRFPATELPPPAAGDKPPPYNPSAVPAWSPVAQLELAEQLAAELLVPMSSGDRAVMIGNARLAGQLQREEVQAVQACNILRLLLGLSALAVDVPLCIAARDHAHDMNTLNFFSHSSPVSGKESFTDRAKRQGSSAGGENIFAGNDRGAVAIGAWLHSPGHFQNMTGGSHRLGVGNAGIHWTMMVGG